MKKKLWAAIIVVVTCILLIACTDEVKNDYPAATEGISVLATDEVVVVPDMRYFTLEDFSSIVIGESTIEDVFNITGSVTPMVMMSPGGVCEYPMRDGKCIRVEFFSAEFVVYDIKIATPIGSQG